MVAFIERFHCSEVCGRITMLVFLRIRQPVRVNELSGFLVQILVQQTAWIGNEHILLWLYVSWVGLCYWENIPSKNYHLENPWEAGEEGRGFRDCVPLLQFLRPIALLVAVWIAISISQSPGYRMVYCSLLSAYFWPVWLHHASRFLRNLFVSLSSFSFSDSLLFVILGGAIVSSCFCLRELWTLGTCKGLCVT